KSRLVLGREPGPAVRGDGAAGKSRATTMFPLWHDGRRNGEESRGGRRAGTLNSRDTRFCPRSLGRRAVVGPSSREFKVRLELRGAGAAAVHTVPRRCEKPHPDGVCIAA